MADSSITRIRGHSTAGGQGAVTRVRGRSITAPQSAVTRIRGRLKSSVVIDAGLPQTVRAFDVVTVSAFLPNGGTVDSYTWRLDGVVIPGVGPDRTFIAPATRTGATLALQVNGAQAGYPDAVDTVAITVKPHWLWEYRSSAPGSPLVGVRFSG